MPTIPQGGLPTTLTRRRRYSDEERVAVLAPCDEPGVTVVGVSLRLGISASPLHGWRKTRREAQRIASEPLQFIPYGAVAEAIPPETVKALASATPAERNFGSPAREAKPAPDDLVRPHPGSRPGGIDIDLASGIRVLVDSYVNEKALARVLRTLREAS